MTWKWVGWINCITYEIDTLRYTYNQKIVLMKQHWNTEHLFDASQWKRDTIEVASDQPSSLAPEDDECNHWTCAGFCWLLSSLSMHRWHQPSAIFSRYINQQARQQGTQPISSHKVPLYEWVRARMKLSSFIWTEKSQSKDRWAPELASLSHFCLWFLVAISDCFPHEPSYPHWRPMMYQRHVQDIPLHRAC